ncbi:MAG: DUF2177 family protein [Hyphomicrobiaceae bacterium]|nr:DUF2177 family protein [Hyphomicrobiaceae bacterium]
MTAHLIAYIATALIFTALDFAWLSSVGASLYRQTLGDILLSEIRLLPAALFYLLYPAGLVIFAVSPAMKAGAVSTALVYGALFGLFTYATYDLTNLATLRNWTAQITVIDIGWGAVMGALVSAAAYWIATWFTG